jgi:23S rRNA (cytidine1920-2'-O)/16S rRNA (cytidine1409-2'-O)-methyltransferase
MAGEVLYALRIDAREGEIPEAPTFEPIKKPGQLLPTRTHLQLKHQGVQDVGRGAQKLRHALRVFGEIDVRGRVGLDIGASTGGFTQVLLDEGAARVCALDVGTNQLHERLRADSRVVNLEKHHVLKMESADWARAGIAPPFEIIVTDVSFISVTKLVATVAAWLPPGGSWIVLVKPQFELGPKKAPGGIVRKPEFHDEAVAIVRAAIEGISSLEWVDCVPSPIFGGDGNKEFLAWIRKRT